MITTTIKIDAADTITIDRIRACAIQFRRTHELLWHYLNQAESGDASPDDIAKKVETAIAAGVMLAVEAFGGTVTDSTICQDTK